MSYSRPDETWGYEPIQCSDGLEAWDLLTADDAPKMAILDWVMPGMDGVDVCRRLREERNDRHVFVYLLTARDSDADVLAGLDAGADDYLTKPVRTAELRIRLNNGRRLVELQDALIAAREAMRDQATKDPLNFFQNALLTEKVLTEEIINQIDESARAEAETSAQFAEASPYPTVDDVQKDVYWEADNPADRKSQGTLFFN